MLECNHDCASPDPSTKLRASTLGCCLFTVQLTILTIGSLCRAFSGLLHCHPRASPPRTVRNGEVGGRRHSTPARSNLTSPEQSASVCDKPGTEQKEALKECTGWLVRQVHAGRHSIMVLLWVRSTETIPCCEAYALSNCQFARRLSPFA